MRLYRINDKTLAIHFECFTRQPSKVTFCDLRSFDSCFSKITICDLRN
jgi:hypothetical protein